MAVEFVGSTVGSTTDGGTDLVLAPHASAQSGDLLILGVMYSHINGGFPTPSSPEWNVIDQDWGASASNDSFRCGIYWAWYDDYVTSAVPHAGSNQGRAGALTVWRGVDASTPIEPDVADMTISTATVAVFPAVTTTTDNARIINYLFFGDADRTVTAFSNAALSDLTVHLDQKFAIVFGAGQAVISGSLAGAGSSGATSVTIGPFGDRRHQFTFALMEQQAGGAAGGGLMIMGVG